MEYQWMRTSHLVQKPSNQPSRLVQKYKLKRPRLLVMSMKKLFTFTNQDLCPSLTNTQQTKQTKLEQTMTKIALMLKVPVLVRGMEKEKEREWMITEMKIGTA